MTTDGPAESAEGEATAAESDDLPLPPGPTGYPLVGDTLTLMRDPYGYHDRLDEYGDVVRYSALGVQFTRAVRPDHVEQVLLHDHGSYEKWAAAELSDLHFAPEGLVFTEGEQWHRQRTAIQDAFTLDRIRGYAEAMRRYAVEMVESWDDGQEVALNEAFSDLTLRVLVHTLFDLDVDERGDFFRDAMDTVNARADATEVSNLLPGWVPTRTNRRYRRVVSELQSFVDELIDERRGREEEYDDLLSLMLTAEDEEGRGMSESEVRDQTVTFLGAGTETTALVLAYAFLELAKNEDVRGRLDEEHAAVLGGEPPTLADLGQLEYTEQVIDETLRQYPPAYLLFREASEDVAIGGYRVPAGSKVALPVYHVHADERWYDDPDTFRPERWTDDFRDALPDYAFFPFGGGPRHCIGLRFAMQELKHIIPTVAQQVEFELLSDPDPGFMLSVTLQPEDDVRVRVNER